MFSKFIKTEIIFHTERNIFIFNGFIHSALFGYFYFSSGDEVPRIRFHSAFVPTNGIQNIFSLECLKVNSLNLMNN